MFLLLFLCIGSYNLVAECTVNRGFRSDYKYYVQAQGWLKFHHVPATWRDAQLRCQLEGAVLASPLNRDVASTMTSQGAVLASPLNTDVASAMISLMNNKADVVYTGIHATFSKGDFNTIEGVPLSETSATWNAKEPNNVQNNEDCTVMNNDVRLADVKCSNVYRYMCYKKNTEKSLSQNECGTTDSEYKLSQETSKCYKFHRTPRTWSRAYMACAAEGGHLAIINSQEEADVISAMLRAVPKKEVKIVNGATIAYIGFHDWGEHGSWLTIHGQTLKEAGYDTWHGLEPNNLTGSFSNNVGEYCGSIYLSGELNDLWCNIPIGFFCEKDPRSLAVEDKHSNGQDLPKFATN